MDGIRKIPTLTTSCPDWLNPLDKASSNKSLLTLVSHIIQTFCLSLKMVPDIYPILWSRSYLIS